MTAYSVQLDVTKVRETIAALQARIHDRFPDSGLHRVSLQLGKLGKETEEVVALIARPSWPLRILSCLGILTFLVVLGYLLVHSRIDSELPFDSMVQTLDAGGNLLLLIGLASIFLWTLEQRVRRRRAVVALNRLRDLAHVIDIKQLTKDPDRFQPGSTPTAHSPRDDLSPYLLGRYLDYSSEMLALVSKLAYLYAANFDDASAAQAVNELENLCTGLSRKIWQKIMILRGGMTGGWD